MTEQEVLEEVTASAPTRIYLLYLSFQDERTGGDAHVYIEWSYERHRFEFVGDPIQIDAAAQAFMTKLAALGTDWIGGLIP